MKTSSGSLMLDARAIGPGTPCFIIGEVAQAHDGSLGMAHAYIDAIAAAGADAVKFQTHIAEAESSRAEPWRIKFSPQDETRFDYWKRMEFSEPQWRGLKEHAERKGLVFLSSPFSDAAVDLLERIDVRGWKMASGEIGNPLLLDRVARTGRPVLISSGMSPLTELDAAVAQVTAAGCGVGVLQCSSVYPTPPAQVGLNLLPLYRERYGCPVGLSDHSGTIFPGLAAVTIGANVLELHVTLSREMFGPDVVASVTTGELAQLVRGVRFIETAMANPVDKDAAAAELAPLRRIFTKSLFAARDLLPGQHLGREDLLAKKPGTGIPATEMEQVIGRKIANPVKRGEMLSDADLE